MHKLGVLIGVSVAAALAGCATGTGTAGPDDAEASLALANSQSAFGYESPDWGTPFWERLGDKFQRARAAEAQPPAAADTQARAGALAASPNTEPMTPYAGTPAIERPAAAGAAAPGRGLHASVAIDWPADRPAPPALAALARELSRAGFVVIPPGALVDAVGNAPGCSEITRPACLASLARYPGPRLLIVARPAGDARVRLVTYDTQFGVRYPAHAVAAGADDSANLVGVARAARRRVDVAPWFTRSFATRDARYYLAAGVASGLKVGDRLAVHNQGELVRGPAGQPVVWEPGERAGQLEVVQLLGDDTSVARGVDGAEVQPTSLLVAAPAAR